MRGDGRKGAVTLESILVQVGYHLAQPGQWSCGMKGQGMLGEPKKKEARVSRPWERVQGRVGGALFIFRPLEARQWWHTLLIPAEAGVSL